MTEKEDIRTNIPGANENPFLTPEGYFENFEARLTNRISAETEYEKKKKITSVAKARKISLKPYLALAATISGIALITFSILQFVIGSKYNSNEYYDLALLEESGIIIDESSISEIYDYEALTEDASWEEEAMDYLASNEVELEYLLAMN